MKPNKSNKKIPRSRCVNYLCIVEGQQEESYIRHLANLLTSNSKKSFKLNPKIGKLNDLKIASYIDYDSVLIFDYDFNKIEF